jgi:hypothetical protein
MRLWKRFAGSSVRGSDQKCYTAIDPKEGDNLSPPFSLRFRLEIVSQSGIAPRQGRGSTPSLTIKNHLGLVQCQG